MSKTEEKIDELRGILEATEVSDLKQMNFKLYDAIREGSLVSDQAYNWGNGDTMCALHAAITSAVARGYME